MTLRRLHDPDVLRTALTLYPFGEIGIDAEAWLSSSGNYMLSDDDGNIGMFEEFTPGVLTGHYFFKDRGKRAFDLSVEMLTEAFIEAEIVRGLTPVKHKAAVYMTRRLGFKDYGLVDTWIGPCVIFMMTKAEFKERYE